MEMKHNITQYRERLDKTLACNDLTVEEALKILVKNQMQSSSCETEDRNDDLVEKRTKEVANFVQMLKSASMNNDDEEINTRDAPQSGWKLKLDTEDHRVMYREGPKGTPFHTLLTEGYVDGPVDVCLCIAWESTLYRKWWPQSTIPVLFKITSSQCLQKVRIGEQISLLRIKVSWPLAPREALVHFVEFEYFQGDLVVVLFNSISDVKSIDKSTHGFSKDGIPDAQDAVRIDVVGGFAIQKVSANRSFFRAIANLDIKLDFVPPSIINFLSRQLIGSGFGLYQKEIASVAKGDEDFGKVLKGPTYSRIREALFPVEKHENISHSDRGGARVKLQCFKALGGARAYPCRGLAPPLHSDDAKNHEGVVVSEKLTETVQADEEVMVDDHGIETLPETVDVQLEEHKLENEIQEVPDGEDGDKRIRQLEKDEKIISEPRDETKEGCISLKDANKVSVSPPVKQAIETLDKVIANFREMSAEMLKNSVIGAIHEEQKAVEESKSFENGKICTKPVVSIDASRSHRPESRNSTSSQSRNTVSNSYLREGTNNQIIPAASPEVADTFHAEKAATNKTVESSDAVHRSSQNRKKQRRHMSCCFLFLPEQLLSKE